MFTEMDKVRTMPVCRVIKVSNQDYKFKGKDRSDALLNASQCPTKLTSNFFPKLEKKYIAKNGRVAKEGSNSQSFHILLLILCLLISVLSSCSETLMIIFYFYF